MKMTLCGSIAFYPKMEELKLKLEESGHQVELPPLHIKNDKGENVSVVDYYAMRKAEKNDDSWIWGAKEVAMTKHFDKIAWADSILVLNYDKRGIANYIGANTFLEMGVAFHLKKKIYLLNPIPLMEHKEELLAMKPIVLNGDITKIPSFPMQTYKHYKGTFYQVVGEAVHTETKERLVVYKPLNEDVLYVRPKEMFEETVTVDGKEVERFERVEIVNDAVYGHHVIDDPLVLKIMNTPEMQRLKGVNQYGVWDLFRPEYFTSRFDHCVGVYILLQKLGASREEQIAGLIHDISHTAFSHVIDYVFDDAVGQTVHEKFMEKVIFNSQIPQIVKKHGFDIQHLLNKHNFGLLERDLPDLCADRVDYFFRDALCTKKCTKKKISVILHTLCVHQNQLVITDKDSATMLATTFIQMNRILWAPPIQSGSYHLMGEILKDALAKNIITEDDFFLTDKGLMKKLKGSKDSQITKNLNLFTKKNIVESTSDDYTYHTKSKVRFVDPLYFDGNKVVRTTSFSKNLRREIEKVKKDMEPGYYIKIRNSL